MREARSSVEYILKRIEDNELESSFVVSDFVDQIEYENAKRSIARLEERGLVKRVIRGIYYVPQYSDLLQEYSEPDPASVAKAIARKNNWTIAASGDTALNMLGLSTQVPANWQFISSGPYKKYRFGNVCLEFEHRSDTQLNGMTDSTLLLIQALKALGKDNVGEKEIRFLREKFSEEEKTLILHEAQRSFSWIVDCIKQICS